MNFFIFMPSSKRFLMRAGNPRCISLVRIYLKPWSFLFQFQEHIKILWRGLLNLNLCQSMLNHIPKSQTRSPNHNPSLWLYDPRPLLMFQLYITPRQCMYICHCSLCLNKQKRTGTSVWSCSYTEALDGTFSWEAERYISLYPPYLNSRRDSLHPRILSCYLQGTCQTLKCRGTAW